MGFFTSSLKHISRYNQIAQTLVKYGFDDVVAALNLEKSASLISSIVGDKKREEIKKFSKYERVRMAFEELGPAFVKFGQILSNRPDYIPSELIKELEKLQDSASPVTFNEIKTIIEQELGQTLEEAFETFDEAPLASASIAQVHLARLKTGQKVVVKVQRPNIEKIIETDTEIMLNLAGLMEKYMPEYRYLNPIGMVKVFRDTIRLELDFYHESYNLERFKANFENDPIIHTPTFYKTHSRKRILTMEFIEGCKISDLEKIRSWGLNPEVIAHKGIDVMFKQIFVQGFFHADPHPGNVFVMPDGRLCYLDFGMMGTIVSDDRENLSSIFIGVFTKDARRIVRALRKLSGTRQFPNEDLLEHRILELVDQYSNLSLKEIKISSFFNQFKNLIIDYKITVPQDFFLLIKAISTTEGVGLKLYPELNLMKKMEPFVQGMLKRKLNPLKFARNIYLAATDMSQFIKSFPNDLRDIVDKLRYGVIKVDIEHLGLEPLNKTLDKVSNRISFAIIAAAMMIGSSMIVHAKLPPFYNGIPILGLIGFILAVFFSLILIWSIFKHGKF